MKSVLSFAFAAMMLAGLTLGCGNNNDASRVNDPVSTPGAVPTEAPAAAVSPDAPTATPAADAGALQTATPAPAATPQAAAPADVQTPAPAPTPQFHDAAVASGKKYACPNGHDTFSDNPEEICGDCQTKVAEIKK